MSPAICRLLYVPSTLAVIGMAVAFGMKPISFPPPGDLVRFTTTDKTLSFEHPANWKPHDNAIRESMTEMWVEPARLIRFYVKADFVGSLMADMDKGSPIGGLGDSFPGVGGQDGDKEQVVKDPNRRALERRHEAGRERFEKQFASYDEEPAEDATIGGMGALVSRMTFKASGLWTQREMVGRRATMNPNDRLMTVSYFCPKDMEAQLGPVFEKMLKTIKREGGQ